MQTGKKKIKSKQLNKATTALITKNKLDTGGLIQYNQPTNKRIPSNQAGDTVDKAGSAVPVWGQVFGATRGVSKGIKGDESNVGLNAFANVISPSSGITSAVEDHNYKDAAISAINPIGGGRLAKLRADKRLQASINQMNVGVDKQLLANAGNSFNDGGKLLSKKLGPVSGGTLDAISDDAVEVKAHDPNATDSVELDNAFVDNKEIIDRKNRVFSDAIKLPSGRTIAKEAKRLEKMKAEDSDTRFAGANSHLDRKLDDLFNYQENMKEKFKKGGKVKHTASDNNFTNTEPDPDHPDQMAVLNKGGKIHIKPENRGKFTAYKKRTGKTTEEALHSSDPHVRKMANFARNAKKWHHEDGGKLDPSLDPKRSVYYIENPDNYYIDDAGNIASKVEHQNEFIAEHSFDKTLDQFRTKKVKTQSGNLVSLTDKLEEKKHKLAYGGIGGTNPPDQPQFKTEAEHVNYYRNKALESFSPEDREVYNAQLAQGGQSAADAIIALRGGLPTFTPPIKEKFVATNPTDWSKLGFDPKAGKGYRYSARGGKGLPAKGSVTNEGMNFGGEYTKKPKFAGGGPFSMKDILGTGSTEGSTAVTLSENQTQPTATTNTGSKINWNSVGNAAATVAPNIANAFLQSRLQGPPTPQLETQARFKRFTPDAQLAEVGRQFNTAQAMLAKGTAQSSDLTAGVGSLLAKRLAANNQIQGQVNNLNAEVNNQEAQLNQGVQARNAERTTNFRNEGVAFKNRKTQLTSENIANLSNKIQSNTRERNQMKKDQQAYEFLQAAYGDSGVLDRLKEDRPDLFENLGKKKRKMGGKLSSKLYMKGC